MKILKQLHIKNFLMLTAAGVINAFGIVFFLYPVQLYDSGISGTSMLIAQLTPSFLPLSLFLAVLNIPLFLYGLKKQGAAFTIYAIYAVGVYALTAWLIMDVLPIDVSIASPLAGTDLLLCALFGGIISGIGSGQDASDPTTITLKYAEDDYDISVKASSYRYSSNDASVTLTMENPLNPPLHCVGLNPCG